MSMYNPGFDGKDLGQHCVQSPQQAPGSDPKGVAPPYTGKPGDSGRGTDETMGTGPGGTLSKGGGIPSSGTAVAPPETSPMDKIKEGVNETVNQTLEKAKDSILG
jgi:hypothetical protein